MKVALVCTGLGQVQRGFERLYTDLFNLLRADVDLTLFKGGGAPAADEVVIWNAPRHGKLNRLLPKFLLPRGSRYHFECLTFAMGLGRKLERGGFDVVHVIDPPLAKLLLKIRRRTGGTYRLIYCHGATMEPQHYPQAEHVHQIAKTTYDEAVAAGIPDEKMSLLPCGVHTERFQCADSVAAIRKRHGVPEESFVVLSVAAVNRVQKRMDYLIEEVARSPHKPFLWIDGNMEDESLVRLAQEKLGGRCLFTHVATEEVPALYKAADLMVLASFYESFGIAVVEALSTGLPVLTYDSPHFQWLSGEPRCWVAMGQEGALCARIDALIEDPEELQQIGREVIEPIKDRFDWGRIKDDYAAMYRQVARMQPSK